MAPLVSPLVLAGRTMAGMPVGLSKGGGGETSQYAVQSFDAAADKVATPGDAYGWVFTVGPANLKVTALRHYHAGAEAEDRRVRIFRNSDDAMIASADVIADTQDKWFETEISPVTLESGVQYTIASIALGDLPSAFFYRDVTNPVITDAVTVDNSGVKETYWLDLDSAPTNDVPQNCYLAADFKFSVSP